MPRDEYIMVKDRLRAALPHIRSITTTVPVMLTEHAGALQVHVTWSTGLTTTGTCHFRMDLKGQSAQATKPIEDAETGALGRALAMAGYYGDETFASFDEIQTARIIADNDPVSDADQQRLQEMIQYLHDNNDTVSTLYPGMSPGDFRKLDTNGQIAIVNAVRRKLAMPRESETEADVPTTTTTAQLSKLTDLLKQREITHDGTRLTDLTPAAAQALIERWDISPPRKNTNTLCKYCQHQIYWCMDERTGGRMPLNKDGSFHHSTCGGVDTKTGKFTMGLKPPTYVAPRLDTLPTQDVVHELPPILSAYLGSDSANLSSLATHLTNAFANDDNQDCEDTDYTLITEMFNHLYPDSGPTLRWFLHYLLGGAPTQRRVDNLLWWCASRTATDVRTSLDLIVSGLAAEYGPMRALTGRPSPDEWPKRSLMVWVKDVLENGASDLMGAKNRADVFLALDDAWKSRDGQHYYSQLSITDRSTIYAGLATDARVTDYILVAADAAPEQEATV